MYLDIRTSPYLKSKDFGGCKGIQISGHMLYRRTNRFKYLIVFDTFYLYTNHLIIQMYQKYIYPI
jgi:hypothetical protein